MFMKLAVYFTFLFALFAIALLVVYWFIPVGEIDFGFKEPENVNFSLSSSSAQKMQFYPNMRFSSERISYNLKDCQVQKENDIETAFRILENKTILEFYPTDFDEDVIITCDSRQKVEEGLFIAGEGGPTNITQTEQFSIILHAKIMLIKESSCPEPNIALHELFHVLGFDHSINKYSIMYPVTNCRQEIGQDMIDLINEIYSIPSFPDLAFINVSAKRQGKYLNTEINIKNNGLSETLDSKLLIYAGNKLIKTIDIGFLGVGYGRRITLSNVWIVDSNFETITYFIESDFNELSKENNKIVLEIEKG